MDLVGLVRLVIGLALVGFLVWIITTYVPMPQPIKTAIIVLVVVIMVLWMITLLFGGTVLRLS